MNYFQALIFAIVEGFTEFLPISSTGHLVLTAKLLNIPQTEFVKSFEIIIQLGAILAVIYLYWKTIWTNKKVWKPIIIAFIPTAVVGLTVYKILKSYLLGNEMVTLYALLIGGIAMIIIEYLFKSKDGEIEKIEDITPKNALIIGLFQSVAIIPGVSRAAATIIGAMLLKTKRKTAVEFSFLLAIPTMAAATGLDLLKSNFSFTAQEYSVIAVGFIGSFIVAIFAIKFFIKFVQNHTFIPFGIYRIILALTLLLLLK
ncbi:MAG TPA: undecaprenyl-diphosphate phosphatase [Candidatus Limnocylindrales bacterium]|nr:undecaprenyl-diphosphate phosphatase [Candidatus Limnocylindrales bacterium]